MIHNQKISLIVPCRNEAGVIGDFVRRIPKYIDEIIVVDNNSTDTSIKEAKLAGAHVIKEKRTVKGGIGYGYAHQTGIKHASGDIVIAMDGDDTYPIQSIRPIVTKMNTRGWDFVSCARFPLDNDHAISWIRRLGIHILNWEVRLLYGYPIKDILTGMWVTRKKTVARLSLSEGGWDFSPEIKLAAFNDRDTVFAEYHINHFLRINTMSKQDIWNTGVGHLWYIAKRRFTIDNPFLWMWNKNWSLSPK